MKKQADNEGLKLAAAGLGGGGAGYLLSKDLLGVDDVPLNALAGTVTAALAMAGYGMYREGARDKAVADTAAAVHNEKQAIRNVAETADPVTYHMSQAPWYGAAAAMGVGAATPSGRETIRETVKAMTPAKWHPAIKSAAYGWTMGRGVAGAHTRTALAVGAPLALMYLAKEYGPLGMGRRSLLDISKERAAEDTK